MEAKTLKNLNKNFDKHWEKLTYSEQKEVVDFMLETLNEVNDFFGLTKKKIIENYQTLNNMTDDKTKEEIEFFKNFTSKLANKKLDKMADVIAT